MENQDAPFNVENIPEFFENIFGTKEHIVAFVVPIILILIFFIAFSIIVYFRRKKDRALLVLESEVADESPQDIWFKKLHSGLQKTRDTLISNIANLFSVQKIDESTLEKLHEVLYRADIGVKASDQLVNYLRKSLNGGEQSWQHIKELLKSEVTNILTAPMKLTSPSLTDKPWVILIVGVNGVGKTTTIGKLAAHFMAQQKSILLCAADTFRAAAIDQLKVWGERLNVDVIAHQPGSDPAAVAYDGVKAAKSRNIDILLIDTAGRLHAKKELMDELGKINRVISRDLPGAPHETLLVIDATTGQNAVLQVKAFKEVVNVTGLVITKLDGTAKGGVIIGITAEYNLPIRYIGVGEKVSDLRTFNGEEFATSLFS